MKCYNTEYTWWYNISSDINIILLFLPSRIVCEKKITLQIKNYLPFYRYHNHIGVDVIEFLRLFYKYCGITKLVIIVVSLTNETFANQKVVDETLLKLMNILSI